MFISIKVDYTERVNSILIYIWNVFDDRLTILNEDLLMKHVGVDSLDSITVLNLHNNGISKLKSIHSLHNLKRLTVSFNELSRLDEVANMVSESQQKKEQ